MTWKNWTSTQAVISPVWTVHIVTRQVKFPGTQSEKVTQVYVSAYSRTYVTDESDPSKGICTIRYSKTNIPEQYRSVAETEMVVYVTISTAATMKPINGAPALGIPADWTADHEYEVTAADGTKKIWKIVVEAGD